MKKKKLKYYFDRAWKSFSRYVRYRDKGICFTCGKKDDPKNTNAGHYVHNKLDFSELNVNCQCVRCNQWLSGNLGVYAERLIQRHGIEQVEDLRRRANVIVKYTREELEGIKEKYDKLYEELQ